MIADHLICIQGLKKPNTQVNFVFSYGGDVHEIQWKINRNFIFISAQNKPKLLINYCLLLNYIAIFQVFKNLKTR
jgi:hypothetical protein